MIQAAEEHIALQQAMRYLAEHSPYYKRLFARHDIDPFQINSVADLQQIPFTTKEDLQEHTNDFICVPRHLLIDYVSTSGTTGKPLTLALTDKDLDRLALNEYNSFKTAGITKHDIIQLMTTADRRFMAGLAYFLGARKLGAGIVRVGNGIPELQWDTILSLQPTVIVCVPSFLLKLIAFAKQKGIDPAESSVKKAICIGEPIRNADFTLNTLGKKIKDQWDLELFSTYASTEMATAFTECEAFHGGHLQPELLVAEVLDEHGKPMQPGEAGELVITTLGVEGMPLLRFKTGDICIAHAEPCRCGRKSLRLSPVLGRKQQRIKYKGTSFYPQALYELLEQFSEVQNYQVEVSSNAWGTDEVLVRIGIKNNLPGLEATMADRFRAGLRVVPELVFLQPEELNGLLFSTSGRKALTFVDRRDQKN